MKHRFLAILLAVTAGWGMACAGVNCDALGIHPVAGSDDCITASGVCGAKGDNLTWELTCAGVLTVSGTGAMADWNGIATPWNDYKQQITTVILPDGITKIGLAAFKDCANLASINIPEGVTGIESNTFNGCASLDNVVLPQSVSFIRSQAFRNCTSLAAISIPANVTTIGNHAFRNCTRLAAIAIPGKVTSIGVCAFYDCSALATLTLGDGLVEIKEEAFRNCANLTAVTIPGSVTAIGDYAFYRCGGLASLVIDNSAAGIGQYAFNECASLATAVLSDRITGIGVNAFFGCASLLAVDIPATVTSVGAFAFRNCPAMASATFRAVTPPAIGKAAFFETSCMFHVPYGSKNAYVEALDVNADRVEEAALAVASGTCGENLMWELDSRGTLTISGTGAMDKWKTYSYVPWKDYAASIKEVILPEGLTDIGLGAFYGCTGLTAIEIPSSVTAIGYQALHGCSSLASVAMSGNVTSIGEYAFKNCTALTAIDIPEGVTAIEKQTFYGCNSLTSVVIPDNALYIGNLAFFNCAGLTDVTFGENIGEIRNQAFYGCTGLTSANLLNSVTAIGEQAFSGCTALAAVTMSDNVTTLGAKAFYKCNSLVSVTMSKNIAEIGDATFFNCTALKDMEIPAGVTSIGESAFQNCAALAAVTIPRGVTAVGKYAFYGCTGMVSATFKCAVPGFGTAPFGGGNNCMFYVLCGSKEAYTAALNVSGNHVEATVLPDYAVASEDESQGAVTVTHAPASCDDLMLSFRADAASGYVFSQWSDGNMDNPRTLTLTQDTALTAVFEVAVGLPSDIILQENESNAYYDRFAEDYDGRIVNSATLNRLFKQGVWSTLCLPFNVNSGMMTALNMRGRVFDFSHATGNADMGVTLYFSQAVSIVAGRCYIVNANAKMAARQSFVFPGVTIDLAADKVGNLTVQDAYDGLDGYNDGTGTISLVGTLRAGILTGTVQNNTYMGLKGNAVFYPNTTTGSAIYAYRGIFRNDAPADIQRVRIVADGETVAELEVVNGGLQECQDVRKYIENGILCIRRNGVLYNAVGQRME